jgi:predicted RNase H-like nuclease (RuvC/YqgF family)
MVQLPVSFARTTWEKSMTKVFLELDDGQASTILSLVLDKNRRLQSDLEWEQKEHERIDDALDKIRAERDAFMVEATSAKYHAENLEETLTARDIHIEQLEERLQEQSQATTTMVHEYNAELKQIKAGTQGQSNTLYGDAVLLAAMLQECLGDGYGRENMTAKQSAVYETYTAVIPGGCHLVQESKNEPPKETTTVV